MTQLVSERATTTDAETSRYAVVAFTWAILGWFAPIPFLLPALALWYAETAQRHVRGNPERLKGAELAHAARSIAWAALAVWIVATVVGFAALVVFAFNS